MAWPNSLLEQVVDTALITSNNGRWGCCHHSSNGLLRSMLSVDIISLAHVQETDSGVLDEDSQAILSIITDTTSQPHAFSELTCMVMKWSQYKQATSHFYFPFLFPILPLLPFPSHPQLLCSPVTLCPTAWGGPTPPIIDAIPLAVTPSSSALRPHLILATRPHPLPFMHMLAARPHPLSSSVQTLTVLLPP